MEVDLAEGEPYEEDKGKKADEDLDSVEKGKGKDSAVIATSAGNLVTGSPIAKSIPSTGRRKV